jgi:hypothetical protein
MTTKSGFANDGWSTSRPTVIKGHQTVPQTDRGHQPVPQTGHQPTGQGAPSGPPPNQGSGGKKSS